MKKINFSFLRMAALLVAGVTLAACTEKNLDNNQEIPEVVYSVSINASKGEDVVTRALSLNGNDINATWTAGDQVTVYNETKSSVLSGALEAQRDGASTTLKGDLTGTIDGGDVLTLKFLSPEYAGQDGTLDYIATHCDYATASVTVDSVDGNIITTTGPASFDNQQAIIKFNLINKRDDAAINATSFTVTAGGSNTITISPGSASNILYVAIPGFAAGSSLILTATDGSKDYTFTKANFPEAIENGSYNQLNVKMTPVPVINVSTNPLYVYAVKGGQNDFVINYTIEDPSEASLSAVAPSWITTNTATPGVVSFDVASNDGDARIGEIELSYPGANNVIFKVSQEGRVYTLSGSSDSTTQADIDSRNIAWDRGVLSGNPWSCTTKKNQTTTVTIFSTASMQYNVTSFEVATGASTTATINSTTISVYSNDSDASSGANAVSTASSNSITNTSGSDWINYYYRIEYELHGHTGNQTKRFYFDSAVFYGYKLLP